jgi:tripartite-type tricarboxylate transporter receptor subunit TctC
MHLADVKERLAVSGYEVVTSTPQQFRDLINADLAKWEKVVKASGARVD